MQGHRKSSVTTLPENMSFDHGSTSSEAGIDSQIPWNSNNNIQTFTHNRLPEYMISSNETNIQYLNSEWSLGETSSTAPHNQIDRNERKQEHTWYEQSGQTLPRGNVDANANGNLFLARDLNVQSGFGDHEDDDDDDDACQIVERPNTYISIGSSNEHIASITNNSSDLPSGSNGYAMEESEDRLDFDGQRVSYKRKALHVGPSSEVGSSNSMSTPTQSGVVRPHDQANPRLRLSVGGPILPNPFSSTPRGTSESSRNFHLRINGSHQQDHVPSNLFLPEADPVHVSSSQHHLFDLNPPPVVENGSLNGQSGLFNHVTSRNSQSRCSVPSSSRTNNLLAPMPYEESMSRNIPRSISEHPMFVPSSETGSSSQQPTNWNLGGGNNNLAGNIGSSSRAGPTWSNRARLQYRRRLSEIVRRSLLNSAGIESGGQSSGQGVGSSSSISSGSSNHGRQLSSSRSGLLSERRQFDGALGLPHSLRSLAAAGEGRASIMSEQIRHVLDLMRRGEGLRFEDVMILDHSILFGMADRHDRHQDMRLDVDNMSYEELLALGERIGNVCTGLKEETIISRLKQRKYVSRGEENEAEREPCSVCREEYIDGEDLGTLECGHDFHKDCIKQWLMHKNLCPICKMTGLTT